MGTWDSGTCAPLEETRKFCLPVERHFHCTGSAMMRLQHPAIHSSRQRTGYRKQGSVRGALRKTSHLQMIATRWRLFSELDLARRAPNLETHLTSSTHNKRLQRSKKIVPHRHRHRRHERVYSHREFPYREPSLCLGRPRTVSTASV